MAEGTWHGGGQRGYGTMFGGGQFDWRKGHPDQVVRSGGYASAAAGAYQFMPDTWNGVTKQLGMNPKDFSPEAQDRAALQLVRNRGVDPAKPLDANALNKLAPEWASLPTLAGKSYYGQPVKGRGDLLGFYSQRVGAAPNPGNNATGAAPAAPVATAPAPAGAGGGAGGGFSLPAGLPNIGNIGLGLAGPLLDSAELPQQAGNRASSLLSKLSTSLLADQSEQLASSNPLLESLAQQQRRQQPTTGQRMAGSPGVGFFDRLLALSRPLG
jgi:hypothetical protein